MRRAGQDYPVFLSALMTNIFLLPLWIPLLYPHLKVNIGEGNGNPLQYSCLEKSHGQKSLVGYIVHGVAKSRTRLSMYATR